MFLNEKLTTEKLISSNELLKDLKDEFKGNLTDFTEFINNQVMKDKKAKAAFFNLYDAFANNKFKKPSKHAVPVSKCLPTQNEIFASNSMAFPCGMCVIPSKKNKKPISIKKQWEIYDKDPVTVGTNPILVYQKDGDDNYYVIDGHHRWSQLACIKPSAEINAVILSADIEPTDVLKITQAVIAKAEKGKELPKAGTDAKDANKDNLYSKSCTEESIIEMCKDILKKAQQHDKNSENDLLESMKNIYGDDKVSSIDDGLKILAHNAKSLPKYNDQAVGRKDMPQTDKVDGVSSDDILDAVKNVDIPYKEDLKESSVLSFDDFVNEGLVNRYL